MSALGFYIEGVLGDIETPMGDADMIVGVGLTLALGFVAGILPAIQAMRLRLADALRREG